MASVAGYSPVLHEFPDINKKLNTYLSKIRHLSIVWEGIKHIHAWNTHPEHIVGTKSSIAIAVGAALLRLRLLLLLLLLDSESCSCSVRAKLRRHGCTVRLSIDGERWGRV